jgi:DNA polymerase I-like protein with 3'-5' exonuclease and polymerase domains
MGKESPDDIYNHINQTLFDNDLTRSQVKLAVLSAMYGVSHARLAEMMQSGSSKSIIRSVRRYFEIDRLERELRNTAQSVGKIFNYFGRPLGVDLDRKHVLVSHFVQSTASDLALVGFSKIVDRLRTLSINFSPIFVIHDALVIDTDEKGSSEIEKLCQEGLDHELGNFPLSMTTVSSENT